MKIEELKIPAPWGHIAAKAWGNADDSVIIAVHGTGDNAASFDNLIPLLPKYFYYVCIDLPGHGHSTAFPNGVLLQFEYLLYPMKVLMDYFDRKEYILMGHGLGAALCTLATQIYSDSVSKLILIDAITSWPEHPSRYANHMKELIANTIEAAKRGERTSYSFEEVKKMLKNSKREGKLTAKASSMLLQRMLQKVGEDKYVWTSDERVSRIAYPSFHFEDIKQFIKSAPLRRDAIFINFTGTSARYSDYKEKSWSLLPVRRYLVKGHHNYHMTNPESVANIISEFLLKENSKL